MSVAGISTDTETSNIALSLKGITKEFPGVRALDNVNLEVRTGEVHGVVGENGAGKSTLMAITSGALPSDSGTVTILDETLDEADPQTARKRGITIVRQEPALMPDLTVAENLYLGVTAEYRPPVRSLMPWAEQVLSAWGATSIDVRDRVEQLGPQNRFVVDICRALAQKPRVLILDEPTEHLVAEEVDVLFRHIRRLVAEGTAVVYISHRLNEVKEIADRITVLRNGKSIGTHEAADLTEDQIVQLIIGRELDVFFPEKIAYRGGEDGPLLSISNLSNQNLNQVSFEVKRGEVIGLAGIEGNGQKNLLRVLAGLEHASGSVSIGGKALQLSDQHSATVNGITYLTGDRHNEGVLTGLSVGENTVFRNLRSLSQRGWVRDKTLREYAAKVIRDFNVKTPTLDIPIESLSGGNQQKALLGSALATEPTIFLVEEPTQGVDVGAKSEIYQLLRDAAARGAIVIIHSSSALELEGVADRVLVMSRGHVINELAGEGITEEAITGSALKADTQRVRAVQSQRRRAGWLAGDTAPLAVVGGLIVVLTLISFIANSRFLGATNVSGILILAAPLALIAMGQLFVLLTGGIDLSTGPLMGLVPVIASFYLVDGVTGSSQAMGWIYMLLVAIAVGSINWAFIDLLKMSPIIATLITYIAVQAVSFTLRPTRGGRISYAVMDPLKATIGFIPLAFIVALIIALILGYFLKYSRQGIAIRAVGSFEESARVNGLNPKATRFAAYLASSLLAFLAGVLLMSQNGTGDPQAGVSYTLLGITAAVLGGASLFGGRGSFLGVILGAILINVVNTMSVFLGLTPDWQYYLIGAMTIASVALYSIARKKAAVGH
ncbi:MAG: ATP-binding cassette domain-containing protein [Actinomycetota bacterium]